MSYMWFEWTQDYKLPKIYIDAKDVPRQKASSIDGKSVNNVKTITAIVNVVDVNVATKNMIIEEQVFQEWKPRKEKLIQTRKKRRF